MRFVRAPALLCLVAVGLLAGCAGFTLVEAGHRTAVGPYDVAPQIAWSRTRSGGIELWTVDGPGLEAVRFFDPIAAGDTLVPRQGDKPLPKFRAGMTATEVEEMIADTLAATGAGDVRTTGLRPASFGSLQGFRFELGFLDADGLEVDGLAAGAVADDRLFLILYTGARLYYFPRYRDAVVRLVDSVRTRA